MSAASSTLNPLLEQKDLPRFNSINPSHVEPAVSQVLSQLDDELASLESALASADDVNYGSVIEAMEAMEAPLGYTWGVVGHLMGVSNSDELRDVRMVRRLLATRRRHPAVVARLRGARLHRRRGGAHVLKD